MENRPRCQIAFILLASKVSGIMEGCPQATGRDFMKMAGYFVFRGILATCQHIEVKFAVIENVCGCVCFVFLLLLFLRKETGTLHLKSCTRARVV